MYRFNPLMRKVLITTDEVIFHAPTKHTLDPRMIQNSIIVAEERLISPALGYDLYQELLTQKNTLITSGNVSAQQTLLNTSMPPNAEAITLVAGDLVNALETLATDNKELWKEHLWKLTAECVMLLAYPEGFVQFGSEGTVHNQPASGPMNTAGMVTPELRSIKWVMDKKMMDRIDPLREAMHLYLCKKKAADAAKFPLYTKACDCNADGIAYKRKSDVILGLYDDEETQSCDCL